MKKTLFLFCLFGAYQAQAQISFNPGIRAGANFSSMTHVDGDTKTDFYAGLFAAIKLTPFYTLQPEFNYSRQGVDNANLIETSYYPPIGGGGAEYPRENKTDLDIQYLGINVINKFEYKKFNFHVGPGLEFVVNSPTYVNTDIDLTINFGVGYDITESLGIEARFKKGITEPLSDYEDLFFSENKRITNSVFQVGLYYKIQ